MTGLEVRRAGQVVLVQDPRVPASGGGAMQAWSVDEWVALVRVIKQDAVHTDILSKDPVLPLVIFGLHRHEPLYVDLDDWAPFVAAAKAGEYDVDKLSSGDAASPVSADGAVRVVAGAGQAGNPPSAPAATEVPPVDVPAGRPTPVPAQVALPQEAGRPGPGELLDLVRPDFLTGVDVDEWARDWAWAAYGVGFAAGLRVAAGEVDEAREWAKRTAPLVPDESSRNVAGGAGPGSPPVGPGPAEPSGGVS